MSESERALCVKLLGLGFDPVIFRWQRGKSMEAKGEEQADKDAHCHICNVLPVRRRVSKNAPSREAGSQRSATVPVEATYARLPAYEPTNPLPTLHPAATGTVALRFGLVCKIELHFAFRR